MTTTVALAGSTGSIGTQTLEVVRAERDSYEIVALAASGRNIAALIAQAEEFRPRIVAITDPTSRQDLADRLPDCEIRVGEEGLASLGSEADVCVNGVVGFAGLRVTLATLTAGRRLALANKESLIAGGPVVQKVRSTPGAELLPVDSEHCAIHQCLRSQDAGSPDRVARLVLTASGGPFRGRSKADLSAVTIEDALAHPTWSMGPKITVDSSTLMNKGLEVIEAHELFGVDYDRIEVVVHPQSIVHSMVEFSDATTIAQLSLPDMRLPIGYSLAWPDRIATPFGRIDWTELARLDFEAPDHQAFPCLGLAYEAGRQGGTAPAWLNAANEEAVAAFLAKEIRWIDIADVLERVLARHDGGNAETVDEVVEVDRRSREATKQLIRKQS